MKLLFGELLHVAQLLLIRIFDSFSYTTQLLYTYVAKFKEFLYLPNEDTEKFHIILKEIAILQERVNNMTINLEALTSEVARVQTVHASTIKLIGGLVDKVLAAQAELALKNAASVPPVDTSALDKLVADLKLSTDALAVAVADSADLKPTHTVVLNADNPELPTIEVTMPEVMPEVVKIEAETVVDVVDTASPEPQIVVTVTPATEETIKEENVVTDVIKTEEGLVDIVVTAPADVHEEVKAETGVDVVEAVKEAYEADPVVEAAPLEVPQPEEIAPEVAVEEPAAPAEILPEVAQETVAPVEAPAAEVAPEAAPEVVAEEPKNPYKD